MTASEKREEGQVEEFDWNVESEIHLFMAMSDSKPAGINKYFHMMDIADKFSALVGREISSSVIWKHLNTLYDMKMCDDIEGIPFPNETKDFSLPESEFGLLMKTKTKNIPIPNAVEDSDGDRAASPKQQATPRSTSRGASVKDSAAKALRKEQSSERTVKRESESSTGRPATPAVESSISSKAIDKESGKQDIRRDSKDSNASSKESGSSKGASSASKATPKETKASKSKRDSVTEKAEDSSRGSEESSATKRGSKRPLRGSLKPEEQPTPPGRRRRI